jgi:hypothetical protein
VGHDSEHRTTAVFNYMRTGERLTGISALDPVDFVPETFLVRTTQPVERLTSVSEIQVPLSFSLDFSIGTYPVSPQSNVDPIQQHLSSIHSESSATSVQPALHIPTSISIVFSSVRCLQSIPPLQHFLNKIL